LANFKGLTAQSLTSTDLFQCKQMQGETLHDYFQKFVQLKAKAPDVPDEIAIEAAIKGLRIGPFAAHLAREKPTSIQQLYDQFEKYCRSDNDLRKRLEEQGQNRQQNSSKNPQKTYTNQNVSNQKPGQGQVLSIKGQPHTEQRQQTAPTRPEAQTRNQDRQGYQGKNWNRNQSQKQRRPYCVFHGENAGHSTKDCPETKETQERMKNKQTAQPPTQQSAREVNTTYTTGHQQYCPMYPALNATQIHPSTLASAYYPNFLPAWRSSPS